MNSVGGAQKVVYLVIDGLGKEQPDCYLTLRRNAAFFAEHPHQTITSVFPATPPRPLQRDFQRSLTGKT